MFENLSNLAKKVFGDSNERELKRLAPLVAKIGTLEPAFEALSDEDLQAKTDEFKARIEKGETLDDLLPEAFATVRETAKRVMGMRPYDCQLLGGIVLHQGKIAEMKTGEGKTLVATMPLYLNALAGNGAHLVTVNDYLAQRDAEWMQPIYNFLGMSVGAVLSKERDTVVKRAAYQADITYGTNNEYGFDYLRDNMKFSESEFVQRGHTFAIVDEVDSILIDEARTPLIISGPMSASIDMYAIVDAIIPLLQNEVHYIIDEKARSCSLTDEGIGEVERRLGIDNLYDVQNMEVLHHVSQALKAHNLFKRDRDYVVRDAQVVIVDEFTGRLMHGRRWSDGLHQAVEAKEQVSIQQESQVYATITFQNYFRMYDKLAGMTGTAATEAAEFASIYDLDTMVIPTNRPIARDDADDIIYKTQMGKFRSVVANIKERHDAGQPVLVGTTSVEKSEIVSQLLKRSGVPHEVLNAKNHLRESVIVAQAGQKGAVTISTNMAGRGTDIKLGGNPEALALAEVESDAESEEYEVVLARYQEACAIECEEVKAAGGLYIIGTERHESRRVDNQLRGRSGRQGDAGGSRFYLSLEDDLMRIFGSDKMTVWMDRMGLPEDEPIEHRWLTRAVENAQKKVEGHNFNIRKNLLEYDDVMNYQRTGIYDLRRRALQGEDIQVMIEESIENVVQDIMDDFAGEGLHPEHWNIQGIRDNMGRVFGIEWEESDEEFRDFSRKELQERMCREGKDLLHRHVEKAGDEPFTSYGQMLLLQYTDQIWKDHLLALDRLRQGVGLRGYGQRNPLLEYKREAFQMYMMMSAMRDEQVLSHLLRADPDLIHAAAEVAGKRTARQIVSERFKVPDAVPEPEVGGPPSVASSPPAPTPVARPEAGLAAKAFATENGLRRNDPCPCGSGRKYKRCCLLAQEPAATT
jgi:preprotein translocase subunit SecA